MQCPQHDHGKLQPVLTKTGVVIDRCESCGGVWLDRGELFQLARDPQPVRKRFVAALQHPEPSDSPSPTTGETMNRLAYDGGVEMLHCLKSGGLWLGRDAVKALQSKETGLSFDGSRMADSRFRSGQASLAAASAAARVLMPLPNLFLRSTLTLAGMYGLLGIAVIAAVEFAGINLDLAVGIGIGVVLLQFLLGPFLMDLSLRWLYQTRRLEHHELPDHLRGFVERICRSKDISLPRFLMIDDGAPQAFTYGHTPGNARIVISRGILDLLEPEEVEGVVAHEIGHAVHWDMALMTIAQLVPLLLYYLYRSLMEAPTSSSGDGKEKGGVAGVAIGAYLLYIVSEYLVLWFSRTREYHADRFAGQATGKPGRLASALVKIAYGLAAQSVDEEKDEKHKRVDAVGAMGIFDAGAAQALALSSADAGEARGGAINEENLTGAMRWDLWNPWAKWYELHSTHPLVAKRLQYLSNQALHMGQAPYVAFTDERPESYWDEFLVDISIHLLPMLALVGVPGLFAALGLWGRSGMLDQIIPVTMIAVGVAMLTRYLFVYRGDIFADMSVAALLKCVKVSAVRPVPCTLRGTVIGRGVPGYIFSEDFVMRDSTGIIFLDYRQPLRIWEFLFGLLKAGDYNGREVVVEGWYRRAPMPYLEIKSIWCDGVERRSWVPILYQVTALALMALGAAWAAVPGDLPSWVAAHCQVYFVGVDCQF